MRTPAHPALIAVTATSADGDGASRIRLNATYVQALEQAGLVPVVIPPLGGGVAAARSVMRAVRGLVLTGGEDVDPARYAAEPHPALGATHAARDDTEVAHASVARERGRPTLAICRGVQLLNVAFGGTLVQDLPSERPGDVEHEERGARGTRTHRVVIEPGSRLAASLGATRLVVNSMHHQAVDAVGKGLLATAHAPDGVVEGVESDAPEWWAVGVQWHPEELTDGAAPWDRALFAAFAAQVHAE
jgi:putative glutamine amidotransferase